MAVSSTLVRPARDCSDESLDRQLQGGQLLTAATGDSPAEARAVPCKVQRHRASCIARRAVEDHVELTRDGHGRRRPQSHHVVGAALRGARFLPRKVAKRPLVSLFRVCLSRVRSSACPLGGKVPFTTKHSGRKRRKQRKRTHTTA
eukprot:4483297-Prymnesium_polylepis.1